MLKVRSGVAAVAALVFGLVLALSAPVSADTTAFWGYWQADGSHWAFAKTGPATAHPKDGAVEGWRFAKASGNTGTPPHARPDFTAVCGSAPAPAGSKRVAVVLDYGEPAEAPSGATPPAAKTACAIVAKDATGSDVLAKVARPQADKSGLICAIDAFGPCAKAAPAPSSSAAPAKHKRSAGSTALTIGVGLVLVLAAGGSMMAVRRRANQ
ncbi:SCO2322 family protein [Actinomadura sp. DC4]|uniref:SCO2322 family protein n=1 Tax=Actinomadura sp. DC4 TaxID=3055069 RepID=UPI0025B1EA14|nr:SCO2322 family protein [Actinomadura sp. DC4]MDN3353245.1 SCO2322 family protein [Actinomadura sp. DC4]